MFHRSGLGNGVLPAVNPTLFAWAPAPVAKSGIKLNLNLSPAEVSCLAKNMLWDPTRNTCFIGYAAPPIKLAPWGAASSMPGGPLSAASMPSAVPHIKLNFGVTTAPKQTALFPYAQAAAATPGLSAAISGRVFNFTPNLPGAVTAQAMPLGLAANMPQIGFEQHAGLWTVADAAQPVLQAALSAMTFTPSAQAAQGVSLPGGAPQPFDGQAAFVVGQIIGNAQSAVQQSLAQGYAVLLDKSSVPTGILKLHFTTDPNEIVAMAGPTGTFALLSDTAPTALLAQTAALLNGGQVPPSVVPIAAPSTPTTPWLTYGLIAAGALAVGAVAMVAMKPKRATANRAARCNCR